MLARLNGLWADRSGTFAIATVIATIPIILAIGFSVDYSWALRARSQLQSTADSVSLSLAASRSKDTKALQAMAESYVAANLQSSIFSQVNVGDVKAVGDDISITLSATLPTNFIGITGVREVNMNAVAVATRAMAGSVEVSLVLDNTWSMSETDAKGVTKIAALRTAATDLVEEAFSTSGENVRVAVVPYADYVNVGTSNRNAAWLSIPSDTSTTTTRTCTDVTSEQVCSKREPNYQCSTTTDGVTTTKTCTGACTEYITKTYDPPKQSCSGGTTTTSTWYGCVGSRKVNSLRLNDASATVPYPGYIATSRACPTEILPLTKDKAAVLANIKLMAPNNGSYKPATYIPAGLIWGLNTLSHSAPFEEGENYDASNIKPRKVLVLMTDGDNTLRYNATVGKDSGDGKHVAIGRNSDGTLTSAGVTQLTATNGDTRTLCSNIKSKDKGIEIFSVALAVDNDEAKGILQECASNTAGTFDHYYDASDSDALASAFSGIAKKLSVVRLKQ